MTPTLQPASGTAQRNPGIELLRALSMFMVIVLHIVVHGGFLDLLAPRGASYLIAWFLYVATYCSVNCYALISGYVGIYSRHRYSALALSWLQVVFYLVLVNLGLHLAFPKYIGIRWPLLSFFPFLRNQYWYFTAYVVLYFFMPYLDKMIHALDKKQSLRLLGCIFLFFSLMPTLRDHNVYSLNHGYSILWLMLLYVTGGILRKHDLLQVIPRWVYLLGFFLCVAAAYAAKIILAAGWIPALSGRFSSHVLMKYISPTILLAAIALLGLFVRITSLPTFGKKLATLLGASSFGIYLLHTHPMVLSNFLGSRFTALAEFSPAKMTAVIFAAALGYFLLGVAVDLLRRLLFRLLRLKPLLEKLEDRILPSK